MSARGRPGAYYRARNRPTPSPRRVIKRAIMKEGGRNERVGLAGRNALCLQPIFPATPGLAVQCPRNPRHGPLVGWMLGQRHDPSNVNR